VKSAESGGPRGYDGQEDQGPQAPYPHRHRRQSGPRRGHTADIQDRDGAPLGWPKIIRRFSWLRHVFADGGYAGAKLKDALRQIGKWTIEIIKRSDAAKGFVVLPRRWVVERTLAWLNRNRRLAKDFEQIIASATAWLFIASSRAASQDHEISPDNFESDTDRETRGRSFR
jgi:putative transposase